MQDKSFDQQNSITADTEYKVSSPKPVFTVAVTGHRDIGDIKQTKALHGVVANFLNEIHEQIQETMPQTECRLLTALAAGADQLAADAINQGKSSLPWQMHVILPFEKSAYRATLAHGFSKTAKTKIQAKFDRLLSESTRTFEIADWDLPTEENPPEVEQYWKNTRFQTLGELLIRQSDVLLAIWRGAPPAGVGGTADVVATALRLGIPVVRIDPKTLKLSLLVGRNVAEDAVSMAQTVSGHSSLTNIETKELKAIIDKILHLPKENPPTSPPKNQFIKDSHASIKAFLGISKDGIRPEMTGRYSWWFIYKIFIWIFLLFSKGDDNKPMKCPDIPLRVDYEADDWGKGKLAFIDKIDAKLENTTVAADAIATARGHAYRSSYVITFLGAVLAVWLGLFGLFVGDNKWIWVSIEVAVLITMVGFYLWAKRHDWHRRWLNARHLAETLRGSRHLAWIGFAGRRPIKDTAPWTAWMANAVMAEPGIPHTKLNPTKISEIAKELNETHVVNQRNYHKKNHSELERLHHRLDVFGWACVGLSIIIAIVYVGLFGWGKCYGNTECLAWSNFAKYFVTFAAAGLPLLAAALAGIRYQGDFERFAQRSMETMTELNKICVRLTDLEARSSKTEEFCCAKNEPLFEELAKIVSDLAKIYEADLDDWRFVYSARPNPGVG